MSRTLSRPERIAWARLARTQRVGALTFHRLLARYKTASAALDALPRISDLTPPSVDKIERELDGVEKLNARLVAACEPDYPPLLAQLDVPPPLLAMRGDAGWLKKPTIALVGSREGSAAALMFTERLAADLGAAGFTIVSGLARGVDAAAHKGALAAGTVAVLAGGLDHPYPPQNLKLHDAICEHGAVISEAPLGTVARARDFPRRNAVISGVSRGVVVIEAALRSGSLITARVAADQGCDVIAAIGEVVPARPLSAGPLFDDAIETPPPSTRLQKTNPRPAFADARARQRSGAPVGNAHGDHCGRAHGAGTQRSSRLAARRLRRIVRRRILLSHARRLPRRLIQQIAELAQTHLARHVGELLGDIADIPSDILRGNVL